MYVGCGSRSDELRLTMGRERSLILSKYGEGSHVVESNPKMFRRASLPEFRWARWAVSNTGMRFYVQHLMAHFSF